MGWDYLIVDGVHVPAVTFGRKTGGQRAFCSAKHKRHGLPPAARPRWRQRAGMLTEPPAVCSDRGCLAHFLAKGTAGIALLHIERARSGLAG